MNTESRVLKTKVQKRSTFVSTLDLRPKGVKPKVLNEPKQYNFKHNAQKKTKPFRTNPK